MSAPRSPAVPSGGALSEVVAATDPSLRAQAYRKLPAGRWEQDFPPGSDRAFVVEAVYEGHLLHYGTPRAFRGLDEDLRLLGGDALYALGLARLADGGDLEAIVELADLISLCARAVAEGRPELTNELWSAGVEALAGGEGALAGGGARAAFARLAP